MTAPTPPNQDPVTSHDSEPRSPGRWRTSLAVAMIVLAGVLMVAASTSLWLKRQALSTDRWTDASAAVLRDDDVRHALSVYLVDQAIDATDPAQLVGEDVPAALRPLALRLGTWLRGTAVGVVDQTLARPGVQRTWEAANRVAHRSLITALDEDGGEVVLDLSPLVIDVRAQLGLGPPANPNAGRLVVVPDQKVDGVRGYVDLLRTLSVVLWIVVVALIAAAIWLAQGWRRSAVMLTGWVVVAVGLTLLVIRNVAGERVVASLAGESPARPGAESIWVIATTLLRDSAHALVAIGVLVAVGAWLLGPMGVARAVRARLAPVFRARPLVVFGGFALFGLLVVALIPGDEGRRWLGTLVLLAIVLVGLEALRRLTLREFPASATADGENAADHGAA